MDLFFLHFYCRFKFGSSWYKVFAVKAVIQNHESFKIILELNLTVI